MKINLRYLAGCVILDFFVGSRFWSLRSATANQKLIFVVLILLLVFFIAFLAYDAHRSPRIGKPNLISSFLAGYVYYIILLSVSIKAQQQLSQVPPGLAVAGVIFLPLPVALLNVVGTFIGSRFYKKRHKI